MTSLYVWVLIAVHTVAPFKHPDRAHMVLMKEYQSTFSTHDKCVAAMKGMNQADPTQSWYCEQHIVE